MSALVAIAIAGCGDDDPGPAPAPRTAETTTAGGDEPGAPAEGEPDFTGLGTWWMDLPTRERVASAEDFIEEFPEECGGVKAADLERQTGIAYGYDFPEATQVAAVMIETCALIRDGA